VYDRTTTATFTGTPVLNGVIAGDSGSVHLSGTATASFADFDVGTGKTVTVTGFTLGGTSAFNYTVTQPTLTADITPKPLTVTGITGDNKVYDRTTAATFSGTPALSGVIAGDSGNVTLSGTGTASFTDFNAGMNKTINVTGFTLSGSRAFNYSLTQPTLTANITPKGLSITADSGQYKAKGSSDPVFTYSQTGLISPDTISGAMTRDAGETPGSYAINQGSLDAGANYTISFTSADFVITGPLPEADEATRPNGATSFNIPVADLLANDIRIATDGSSQTDQLSVSMVTSGAGNSVVISGSNVVYTPDDPNDTTDKTFTYTVLDSASGTTEVATVTVHTAGNAAALSFEVTDIVSPPTYNGSVTSVTVSCTATASQTITIEYSTNLVTWTALPGSFNTGSGTFNVTVTAPGNQTTVWNAGMFFRASR
jgi:hypothetical protein